MSGTEAPWTAPIDHEAQIKDILADTRADREEIKRLREFARFVMQQVVWDGYDIDGGSVQDEAERLGLIELRPIRPEDSIDGETEHYFLKWS